MKGNIVLLTVLGLFFLVASAVYTVWNVLATGTWEIVGTVGILLSAILAGFIAFFFKRSQSVPGWNTFARRSTRGRHR